MIAGTMNGSGSLRVQVGGSGERIALAGMRLVQQAQTSRSRAQALTDRAAEYGTNRADVLFITYVEGGNHGNRERPRLRDDHQP